MARMLIHPDSSSQNAEKHLLAIQKLPEQATIIKDKRKQTIYSCSIDHTPIIIKKYQISSIKKKIATFFRHSRAERSFRAASIFKKNSIPTPLPHIVSIAGTLLPHTAYITFTRFDGSPLTEFMSQNPEYADTISAQIADVFKKMSSAKITHGDLHVLNILVNSGASISIIDLDGVKIHSDSKRLIKCYQKDRLRIINTAKQKISPEFGNLLSKSIPQFP